MNAITHALTMIMAAIPKAVLEKTFISNVDYKSLIPISVESLIRDVVIHRRVFNNINLIAGTQENIDISDLPPEYTDTFTRIYRIPKNRTQGRTIVSVISIGYGLEYAAATYAFPINNGSMVLNAANMLVNSLSAPNINSTAFAWPIGENVIMLRDNVNATPNLQLRVWLENDSQLNNIQPTSYHYFGELCLLAVKSFIYTNNILQMDQAYLHAGYELGVFRDFVQSCSESEREYKEYLIGTWSKVAHLNDPEWHRRHLASLVGGGW